MIESAPYHCFKCTTNDDLTAGEYLKYGEPCLYNTGKENIIDKYLFFGRNYNESVWISDITQLFLLARKGIKQLEQAALKTDSSSHLNNYSEIRNHVCELWLAARHMVVKYKDNSEYNEILKNICKTIKDVVLSITRLNELPDYVLFNSVKHLSQVNFNPSYNFLHLYIDLQWILITLDYQKENDTLVQLENFEENINNLLVDLIYIGLKKFERGSSDVDNCTPFLCSCFKELWLLLQLLIEDLNSQHFCKDFWSYFNKAINEVINIQNSVDGKEPLCCLWLLYHVAKIHGYDSSGHYIGPINYRVVSNYNLVEQCLKSILQTSTDEKRMRVCLQVIAALQIDWWTRDATFDLLQLQWEHFNKRIHTSFTIASDSNMFVNTSQRFCNFATFTEKILNCDHHSSNSYELFLYLLSFFLKRNPSYWAKLKGRIYSKLSASKLATFNDTGLQNLVLLLLTLANSVNFIELTEKLLNMLNQLPANRCEDNAVIWSAHFSLVILYVKRDMSIKNISAPILNLVEQASVNRSRVQLMKLFTEGLNLLVKDLTTFQCSEHVLFASNWLKCYLQWCPHTEACNLLELLVKLIDKLKVIDAGQEWWNTLDANIVPPIIHLSNVADAPVQVAEVAAALVSTDSQRYLKVIEQLTGDTVNVELVERFLSFLLQRAEVHQIMAHQSLIIQAWIRIHMLTLSHHDIFDITLLISRLPQWSESFGSFVVHESENTLYAVIKMAGLRIRDAKTFQEITTMKRWTETYFGKMDKWVLSVLNSADKSENNRLVMGIYTYGALLFIHCTSALYTKNKSSSLFHRLVSTLLLPSSILMNKKPPDSILAALKVTWHLYVKGILQLEYKNDTYIERVLKDIIIRYVPHLNENSSPVIRCLDPEFKDEDTSFIIDKMASLIIYRPRIANEFAPQTLNLIYEMILANKPTNKIKILIEKVFPSLLEQLMFVENPLHKKIIVNILHGLKNYSDYSYIREIVKSSILAIIDKHLAFYSGNVFQMLEFLSKVIRTDIQDISDQLRGAIEKVERMRGVGYDNTLRKGLKDIQEIVKK